MKQLEIFTAVSLLIVSFIAGGVIGIIADRVYVKNNFHKFAVGHFREERRSSRHWPQNSEGNKDLHIKREHLVNEICRAVNAENEQRLKIQNILDANLSRIEKIFKEEETARKNIFEKISEIRKTADSEIAAVLNIEQKVKFAEFTARFGEKNAPPMPDEFDRPPHNPLMHKLIVELELAPEQIKNIEQALFPAEERTKNSPDRGMPPHFDRKPDIEKIKQFLNQNQIEKLAKMKFGPER
ncbi:MAG: hypothetical protein A2096_17855 [Spirochaetes bacterium GWF1_41_5]|nr:MAG: hypothetical protein A2096_17855 [Spirochaetes bacterium GWF1_41_5]HBE01873.1 hypothetical protein [Spirochaetia bacterium]